jgi:hypothetical protein
MTVAEKIVGFLNGNRGVSYCDACLEKRCSIPSHGQVALVTSTLELFPEFFRARGRCGDCARLTRLATRAE